MKSLLIATATAALLFAAPSAFADPPDNNHHGNSHQGDHDNNGNKGNKGNDNKPSKPAKPSSNGNTPDRSFSHSDNARAVNAERHGMTPTTQNPGTAYQNARNNDNKSNRNNNSSNHNGNWNNNNNHNDRSHNWNGNNRGGSNVNVRINFNRRNVTASHHYRYRGGAYRWPGGYHYQRWSFGATLPSIFFGQDYWINDYSDYGLAYPPEGAVWVRYGNDALLVDRDNGEILEVVYGQFE